MTIDIAARLAELCAKKHKPTTACSGCGEQTTRNRGAPARDEWWCVECYDAHLERVERRARDQKETT